MFSLRRVSLEEVIMFRDRLTNLSYITEQDIKDIWIKQGDENLDDFSTMEYRHNAPLYQKMIWSYRSKRCGATTLYQGCDICNQQRLLAKYNILLNETSYNIMEFIRWIRNSITAYDIDEIESDLNGEDLRKREYMWYHNNITYFYSLSIQKQQTLLEKYYTYIYDFCST